ncbi:MAG: hypothetical protein IJU01_04020 [Lachnospiraceae bacterium]|nr:hypothetical protein [Lachnospiraceae bacterium]
MPCLFCNGEDGETRRSAAGGGNSETGFGERPARRRASGEESLDVAQ